MDLREPRPHLRKPKYGVLTQGTVFSCARAYGYETCDVLGLTITARCDVSQQKYPVLNYVPVVSLHDWLRRDGLNILVDQELSEQAGTLRTLLRQGNISESLPSSVPLINISETHFPINEGNRAQKVIAERFREFVDLTEEFKSLSAAQDIDATYDWFRLKRATKVTDLIRRLSRHSVMGHYFLETLSNEESQTKGHVCLLREVNTLSRVVAEKLGSGLEGAKFNELCDSKRQGMELLIPSDEMAMPIIEIGSPTIEHVLQSFSNLFGRIGVADPVEDTIGEIINNCLTAHGEAKK